MKLMKKIKVFQFTFTSMIDQEVLQYSNRDILI